MKNLIINLWNLKKLSKIVNCYTFRTNTVEARQADHQFLGILQTCRECCLASESLAPQSAINTEEMMLLDVNPPLESIDQFWIRQTEEMIAMKVKSIQDILAADSKSFADVQRSIRENGMGLKVECDSKRFKYFQTQISSGYSDLTPQTDD